MTSTQWRILNHNNADPTRLAGGTNPALRTFYYRLLRLISLSIHPLFVFDGPNKPPFKRNKRTGPNVASIPEFLAKQLLKQFGLPFHIAPGEAEAECAHLQGKGIVDAVLSEDVDTLMFGSGLTLRNWSSENKSAHAPTHVNVYDAHKTKETAGLDREGMILVAMMSGGDYIPEGIPGCGPKTACQAAKAGFGHDLVGIAKNDDTALEAWKDRLKHELCTNESKYFQKKSKALVIPDDFPRRDILRYYTHPCLSADERIEKLKKTLKWDQDIDFDALRIFTAEAFEWICVGGAKKFIRNLAPALLIRNLRLRGENGTALTNDDPDTTAKEEAKLIKNIDKRRNHVTTDGTSELKVAFIPHDLVPIDLSAEDPDPELPLDGLESEEEAPADEDAGLGIPKKKRAPPNYDPTIIDRIWVFETYLKVGVPLMIEDWEASFRDARQYEAMKAQRRLIVQAAKKSPKKAAKGGMPKGALDRFAKHTKPGGRRPRSRSKETSPLADALTFGISSMPTRTIPDPDMEPQLLNVSCESRSQTSSTLLKALPSNTVDLLSSPAKPCRASQRPFQRAQSATLAAAEEKSSTSTLASPPSYIYDLLDPLPELPPSVTKRRRRSPLCRTNTYPIAANRPPSPSLSTQRAPEPEISPSPNSRKLRPSSSTVRLPSPPGTPKRRQSSTSVNAISLLTSSPAPATPKHRQRSIVDWLSPSPQKPRPPSAAGAQYPIVHNAKFGPVPRAEEVVGSKHRSVPSVEDPFLDPPNRDAVNEDHLQKIPKSRPRLRAPLAARSDNTTKVTEMLDLTSVVPQQPPAKPFHQPRSSSIVTEPIPQPQTSAPPPTSATLAPLPAIVRLKKTLRVRDSLPGTFALEVLDLSGPNTDTGRALHMGPRQPDVSTAANVHVDNGTDSGAKKRKASPSKAANGQRGQQAQKRWRVSQVEVLDLTGA